VIRAAYGRLAAFGVDRVRRIHAREGLDAADEEGRSGERCAQPVVPAASASMRGVLR
jgi:hypothetical protein